MWFFVYDDFMKSTWQIVILLMCFFVAKGRQVNGCLQKEDHEMGLEGKELEELYLRQYSGAGEEYRLFSTKVNETEFR